MNSLILTTATRYLLPLLLLFSTFLLLRGHNEPGGGFVGGLVAGGALSLVAIGLGLTQAQRLLAVDPRRLIYAGLLVAALSGLPGLLLGQQFLTGLWADFTVPVLGKLGTPFVFDVGVYLVVIGITLTIVFALMDTRTNDE